MFQVRFPRMNLWMDEGFLDEGSDSGGWAWNAD